MDKQLPHVRKALYSQPWAITEEWLDAICEIVEVHVRGGHSSFDAGAQPMRLDRRNPEKLANVTSGVATIPIMGPIFPRANMMTEMSGATSLERVGMQFDAALVDPAVSSLLLLIDSPGGAVTGTFEMASKIWEARQFSSKPIIALAEGTAASAAYLLGSQADEFHATEASIVGSIGIIAKIDNLSRAEKNAGNDAVVIRSGPLKAAGVGGLSPDQETELRNIVQIYFDKFKTAVGRARPMMDMGAVSSGAIWVGDKAQNMGLVDSITTKERLLKRMSDYSK